MVKRVSGSRLARLTRVGWLSRKALPIAWRRLREAGDARTDEERAAIAEDILDKHADVAEEAFRTLGELKGLALKVGQMAAYLDGALPEAYREVYQRVLSRLLQDAPSLPWTSVEPMMVSELGGPVSTFFSEFETTPFAAASIGQVHRATLPNGKLVAVKVQYPGVEKAMGSDLKNARFFHSFAAPILGAFGRSDTYANMTDVFNEVRDRLLEELDYEREARMQERFRSLFAHDPEVRIPRVHRECSTRRIITSDLCEGRSLHQVCDSAPQAMRDRYGIVLTRVMLESVYQHRLFNADPHPGNYLFRDDGSVVFLDFGCIKEIPLGMGEAMRRYIRAALLASHSDAPEHWTEFDLALTQALRLDQAEPAVVEQIRDFMLYCLRPFLRDEPFEFTTAYTGESIDRVLSGTKKLVFGKGRIPHIPKMPAFPPDYTLLNRLQWGFYSILTMLRARGNWHRMLGDLVGHPCVAVG